MRKTEHYHQFRNSGASARDWKRRIALLAKRGSDSMRSLQFPLDMPEADLQSLPLSQIMTTYNAIEGTGPGSIFNFWATVHLAGFRFFPQSAGATIFRQQAIFNDDSWIKAFRDKSGKEWAWLKPSAIFDRFSKAPREITKRDGSTKSIEFSPANVANECHVSLVGGSITDKTATDVKVFFDEMGGILSEHYDSWKEANGNLQGVMSLLDTVIGKYAKCASLADMAMRFGPTKPDNSTIAWAGPPNVEVANKLPAIFARSASRYGKAIDAAVSKFVQTQITTPNVTGLSWLFGNGWRYFRDTEIDTIMCDYEIPEQARPAIQAVKEAAFAIPEISLFGKKSYSTFRSIFGGKIDSWTSNYGARLIELQKLVQLIEPGFSLPDELLANEFLISGTDMSADEIGELVGRIYAGAANAQAAVSVLLGEAEGDTDLAITHFEEFSSLVDSLHGVLQTMKSRVERSIEIAGSDQDAIEKLLPCKFDIPKWCASLPKLVGISGGAPDVNAEIAEIQQEFNAVRGRMHDRFNEILSYVQDAGLDANAYAMIEQRELDHIRRASPQSVPARANVQAYRNVLHRIGRAVQNCSEETKQQFVGMVRETGVFENTAHLNTFIFNQKGAIYRSPFDKAKNAQYRVRADRLLEHDWLQMCKELASELWDSGNITIMEDALRLQRTITQITLSGLPKMDYPSNLAQPDIDVAVPVIMQMQINKPTVPVEVLQKAFNLYSSKLSGLTFKLLRTKFIVKLRFSMAEPTQLVYVPKEKAWSIPKQYQQADGWLGEAVQVVQAALPDGGMPTEMIAALEDEGMGVRGEFMRQSPHDWYFDLGLDSGSGMPVGGYVFEKGKPARKLKKPLPAYRMVGAPSYKTVLDKSLVGLAEISQASIIFELNYTQAVQVEGDEFTVSVAMDLPRVTLTLPVKETITATEKDESMLFDRFIAIDLGETGLGYAVFDAKTGEKIDSGNKNVPDIRNLVRRTSHYEQKPNMRQKFQARFNVNMAELRENVAGNVCHHINRLCAYYGAFPVLEYMAGGKLNPQVASVYETVTNRYVWSSTTAHKTERQQFWLGGEVWEHPFLKNAKDGKNLVLSPGRGVSGKGTSQRCSCCGENPIDLLNTVKPGAKLAVLNGRVTVNGKTLVLHERAKESEEEFRKRRREKRRPDMRSPLASGNYKVEDLMTIVRRNLRQAPTDTRTSGTTVSRYHCVIEGCGNVMHADENAGINIGEKFLQEVLR